MMTVLLPLFLTLVAVPPPPRISAEAPSAPYTRDITKRAEVAVEASAGGQMLWSGTLRIGHSGGANFQRSITQALPAQCTAADPRRSESERSSFRISLNNPSFVGDSVSSSFNVEWQRPMERCGDSNVTQTIALSGSTELRTGKTVTVQGDAGLVVRFKLLTSD